MVTNGNLSTRQFSNSQPTVSELPIQHAPSLPKPITEPYKPRHSDVHFTDSGDRPLALGAATVGSVNQAAAWRKPSRVLPFSAATAGSVFKPYGD